MMTRYFILLIALSTLLSFHAISAATEALPPKTRALVVVDSSVYPQIRKRLEKYIDHIRWEFQVELKVLSDNFYDMKPPEIRAKLRSEYENSSLPLVGAIMVGPIPHAIKSSLGAVETTQKQLKLVKQAQARGDKREAWKQWVKMPYLTPAPLYYEDFDASWIDEDGDGVFERMETDAETNPTEIWTAWWVPPTNNRSSHPAFLNSFLKKLHLYHSGRIDGRNGMIFIAGNGNSGEITEAWTGLMNGAMESTPHKVTHVVERLPLPIRRLIFLSIVFANLFIMRFQCGS